MNREFLVNISFLLAINLLIKPFYIFGIDLTIQNRVGENAYGLYAVLFDFTFLFYILNDIGVQHFNNRTIAQHNHLIDKYLPNLLSLKIILALVFLVVVGGASWVMDYPSAYYPIILFVAINHILISWVSFLRTNVSGLGMYRKDSLLSALDKLLLIGICAVLLWGNFTQKPFQIEWLIWSQTAAWTVTALTAFFLLKNKVNRWHLQWNPTFWKAILKQSYPFALVFLLMTVYTRIDKVMIERLVENGNAEAGIYAASFRLLDAASMLGYLFAGLLLPMFASMLKKKESVQALVDLSFQLIMAGAITLAISVFFFREEIMFLLYDNASVYWADVLKYLILTFPAIAGIYIYSTLLTANASLKKMNFLFGISILINVSFNFLFIQQMQAEGAAIATLITQYFVLFGTMFLCKKELKITISLKMIARILGFACLFALLLQQLFHSIPFSLPVKMGNSIFLGILLSFLFRLINWRELLNLATKR